MSENAGHKHVYSPGIGADNPISLSVFFSQYTPFAAGFPLIRVFSDVLVAFLFLIFATK